MSDDSLSDGELSCSGSSVFGDATRSVEDLGEESNIEESVEELMDRGHRGKRGPPPTVEVDVQEFKRLCTLSGNDRWTVAHLAQHFECSIARVKTLKRSLGLTVTGTRAGSRACDIWVAADALDERPSQ
jgi:hypothetical protein